MPRAYFYYECVQRKSQGSEASLCIRGWRFAEARRMSEGSSGLPEDFYLSAIARRGWSRDHPNSIRPTFLFPCKELYHKGRYGSRYRVENLFVPWLLCPSPIQV